MKMIKLSFCLFSVLLLFSSCENHSTPRFRNSQFNAITFHVGDKTSGAPPTGMFFVVTEEDDDLYFVSISTCNLSKHGYFLFAWNTKEDGSGFFIPKEGLTPEQAPRYRTRIAQPTRVLLNLYPVWIKNGSTFLINPNGDGTAKIELSIANEETITVPDTIDGYPITSIGRSFSWFQGSAVRAIIFPDSVTDFEPGAFISPEDSQSTRVDLPNTLKTLNANLFSNCTNLTSIILPASLTSIGEGCFSSCTNLTSIVFPETLLTIEYRAFENCTNLASITLPDGIETIGGSAFSRCSSLLSIKLPDSLEDMGGGAFQYCTNLTTVTNIPNSLTSLFTGVFEGCSGLTSIILPSSLEVIARSAFSGCSSLTSIILPSSLTLIYDYAFYGCSSLTSIVFPDTLTSIDINAFAYCKSLQVAEFKNANCSIVKDWYVPPFINTSPLFKIRAPSGGTVNAFCTENGIPFEPVI